MAVDDIVAQIEIFPTLLSSRGRLTINGATWASGAAYPAQLHTGANEFALAATSPDGQVTHTYTLVIARPVGPPEA